jgi:hypothetical protein
MKYFLLLSMLLPGCMTHTGNTTLFLKEDNSRLYDLKAIDCIESGLQVVQDETGYKLITYYKNCDVRRERHLDEIEVKQWIVKKSKK